MTVYAGDNNNIARTIEKIYIGDNNDTARTVIRAYAGDENNIARKIFDNNINPRGFYLIQNGIIKYKYYNINSVTVTTVGDFVRFYKSGTTVGRIKFKPLINFGDYHNIVIDYEITTSNTGRINYELFETYDTSTSGRTDLATLYNSSSTIARNTVYTPFQNSLERYFGLYLNSSKGVNLRIYNLWLE